MISINLENYEFEGEIPEVLSEKRRRKYRIRSFIERNIFKFIALFILWFTYIIYSIEGFDKFSNMEKSPSAALQFLYTPVHPLIIFSLIIIIWFFLRKIKKHGFKLLGLLRRDQLLRHFLTDLDAYPADGGVDAQKRLLQEALDANPDERPDYYWMDFAFGQLNLGLITLNENKPDEYFRKTELYKIHRRDWYHRKYGKNSKKYHDNDLRRYLINPFVKIHLFLTFSIIGIILPMWLLLYSLILWIPMPYKSDASKLEKDVAIFQAIFGKIFQTLSSPQIPLRTLTVLTLLCIVITIFKWDIRFMRISLGTLRLNRMLRKYIRALKRQTTHNLSTAEIAVGLVENDPNSEVIRAKNKLQDYLKKVAPTKRVKQYPDYYDLSYAYGKVTPEIFIEMELGDQEFHETSMYVNHKNTWYGRFQI